MKPIHARSTARRPAASSLRAPALTALILVALAACESTAPAAASRPAAPASAAPTAAPATAAPATAAASAAPSAAPGPGAEALATLLLPYLTIQEALASDTLTGVADAAKQLSAAARAAGQPAVADAADTLGGADIKVVRENFKKVSNPMADWALADPGAKGQYVIVHCPMAPGSWVQKHRKVRNPYYGKEMLECGDPKN